MRLPGRLLSPEKNDNPSVKKDTSVGVFCAPMTSEAVSFTDPLLQEPTGAGEALFADRPDRNC